jgi:hypothetical protein
MIMSKSVNIKLLPDQEYILEKFLDEFLPPTENKRKHSGNEINFITNSLNRVFVGEFGFRLNNKLLLKAFKTKGYSVFNLSSRWDVEAKDIKPDFKSREYSDKPSYTFINVNPTTVRDIKRIFVKLNPIIGLEKMTKKEEMFIKLVKFERELPVTVKDKLPR